MSSSDNMRFTLVGFDIDESLRFWCVRVLNGEGLAHSSHLLSLAFAKPGPPLRGRVGGACY